MSYVALGLVKTLQMLLSQPRQVTVCDLQGLITHGKPAAQLGDDAVARHVRIRKRVVGLAQGQVLILQCLQLVLAFHQGFGQRHMAHLKLLQLPLSVCELTLACLLVILEPLNPLFVQFLKPNLVFLSACLAAAQVSLQL